MDDSTPGANPNIYGGSIIEINEYVDYYAERRPEMLAEFRRLNSNVPFLRESTTRLQNWLNFLKAMARVLKSVSVPVSKLSLDRKEAELDQKTLNKRIEDCKSGEYASWFPLVVERLPDSELLRVIDGNHRAGAMKEVLPHTKIEVVFSDEIMMDF